MKNIRIFLSEKVHFLVMKFSVYLNRRVYVMLCQMALDVYMNICQLTCNIDTPLGIYISTDINCYSSNWVLYHPAQ